MNSILCTSALVIAVAGAGHDRRSRARGVSGAFERQHDALRADVHGHVCDSRGWGAATLRKSLPAWLKWVSVAGFCASLFSLLISVYPFVDVVNPLGYAAKIGGTVVVSNIAAVVFYKLRNRETHSK